MLIELDRFESSTAITASRLVGILAGQRSTVVYQIDSYNLIYCLVDRQKIEFMQEFEAVGGPHATEILEACRYSNFVYIYIGSKFVRVIDEHDDDFADWQELVEQISELDERRGKIFGKLHGLIGQPV